ncbi:NRDE family protein [Halomonas sp. TRM85114]|uniref:NRDE family protein n=1 Tax=Halomonas jincaotanensis TaxID=2810616 RepID=UPI001BD384E3|nr:NRDE family protein [Halomonas jincaotanensis]MBS9404280.1 NRDE family protein [Halomonas jincaotanensis]
MCLIALDHRPGSTFPLRLVANRDEFHARPTAPLAAWDEAPAIVGGRDMLAGGSWLAVHRRGRFAAVTNVRDPRLQVGAEAPSRGALVRDALEADALPAWLDRLAAGGALRYAGFNLLVGDGKRLWHLHRGWEGVSLQALAPGLHGLSNAGLDTPWPKLIAARQGLAASVAHQRWPQAALEAMRDSRPTADHQLPDTGIELELERRLSAAFIVGEDYGTRATTWLEWRADGCITIGERRFGPEGVMLGEDEMRVEVGA